MDSDDFLQIAALQKFLFCRRQFALIYVENMWADNIHTVTGSIVHKTAHDSTKHELRGDVLIIRAMRVFSGVLGVSGECDVVEFRRSDDGISLQNHSGLWKPYPIEYKKGSGKHQEIDAAQLCCQAMCLEFMLCCNIDRGFLYYGEIRRRIEVEFTETLRNLVRNTLDDMRDLVQRQHTPVVKYRKSCRDCSLFDLCMPKGVNKGNVAAYMLEHLGESL